MDSRSVSTSRMTKQKGIPLALYKCKTYLVTKNHAETEKLSARTTRKQSEVILLDPFKILDGKKTETYFKKNMNLDYSEVLAGPLTDRSPSYKNKLPDIKFKHESAVWLRKHREVLLEILKNPGVLATLNNNIIRRLKELTVVSDNLSSLLGNLNENLSQKDGEDAILGIMSRQLFLKDEEIAGLKSASDNLRDENRQLASMIVSIETQQKLSKDLSQYFNSLDYTPKRVAKHKSQIHKLPKCVRTLEELLEMISKENNYEDVNNK